MSSTLNIKNMLFGDVVRLRYVRRFSTCRVVNIESVAEHSYYTTLYGLMISRWYVHNGSDYESTHRERERQVELVLKKAVCHDLEEALIGDIPRSTKWDNDSIHKAINSVSSKSAAKVLDDMCGGIIVQEAWGHWHSAKSDTIAGKIVEFADYLAALSYILQEIKGNNELMREHAENQLTRFHHGAKFDASRFDFIRPLVQQMKEVTEEWLNT